MRHNRFMCMHLAGDAGAEVFGDDAERSRALRYSTIRQWLMLAGLVWSAAVSLVALETGLSARLRQWAEATRISRFGPVLPYTLVASLASFVTSLPLSFIGGYVVEHRYQLSNQRVAQWFQEELKGLLVTLVLSLPLVQGIYWVIGRFRRFWWAVLSACTVPLTVLLVNLAPVLIMPLFNKFEPVRDHSLADRIKNLAARHGVTVSEVLQMDMSKQTKKANAFFTGLGRSKRIVLGDTLIEDFTPDEVEVVLAHELGHQVHRDLWKLIAVGTLTTTLTSYIVHRAADPIISRVGSRFGLDTDRGVGDVAALPLLGLLTGGVSMILMPLQNAFSRNLVEHAADRYALDITGKRDAFVGAMQKLGRLNLANPRPSRLIKWLLYSHPPIQERIDFAQRYQPPAP